MNTDTCTLITSIFIGLSRFYGTLPTTDEGIVERQICIKHHSDCCNETMTIKVKNCQAFHVLHMKPVDGCPSGYCFESTIPCGQPLPEPPKPVVDPCENPSPFPTHNLGSRNEHCETQQTPACDYYLPQDWYTIDKGTLLAHCPSGTCGVGYPVWLNGSLPRASDGIVHRRVCIKDHGDCCKKTVDIQIKKCIHGFVYNLPPLDGCPSAYCFESQRPCIDPTTTTVPGNGQKKKSKPNEKSDTLLIVIAVISSLVLLIVAVGLTVMIHKCYKKNQSSNSTPLQPLGRNGTVTATEIKSLHGNAPQPPPYEYINK